MIGGCFSFCCHTDGAGIKSVVEYATGTCPLCAALERIDELERVVDGLEMAQAIPRLDEATSCGLCGDMCVLLPKPDPEPDAEPDVDEAQEWEDYDRTTGGGAELDYIADGPAGGEGDW